MYQSYYMAKKVLSPPPLRPLCTGISTSLYSDPNCIIVFLSAGMKKEYILSEAEKKQKKQKIEENRVRKHQKQMTRNNKNSNQDDSTTSSPSPHQIQSNESQSPDDLSDDHVNSVV